MRRLDALWIIYAAAMREAEVDQLDPDTAQQSARDILKFYTGVSDGVLAGAVEDLTGERPTISG